MKRFIVGISAVALFLISGVTHAAPIFSYTVVPNPTSFTGLTGGNSVTLAGGDPIPANNSNKDAGFPGGTIITVLTVTTNAPLGSPTNAVTNQNASFALTITDSVSGKSGVVNFMGTWNGSLGNNNSSLSLTSFSPTSPVNLQLDGFVYTVSFITPSFNGLGTIPFQVNVSAIAAVPEPSSIVVLAVTMVGGLFGTRRFLRSR